ncbi:MAG: NYN domain-containing protein [Anaerolineae bacterium]
MIQIVDGNDVAVFVDFENVYISLRNNYNVNPNFEHIMDKCEEYGRVIIARAYADWYRYPRVTNALYANSIEPMYVPTYYYDRDESRSSRAIKNSVDIHLVIDMMRTLYSYPNIKTYVLVTGDRDFIPLINTVRQHGKKAVVVGVAGAASSHLAQSADEFIFYHQLMDMEEKPGEEKKDIYDTLVEAVHLARKRGITCTLASLKLLMIELLGDFDQANYKDSQGRAFVKFKDFVKEAERRGLVQIFTSGTVNEVFLPEENPFELSQFAPEPSEDKEELGDEEEEDSGQIGAEEWDVFIDTMRQFDQPVLFIQIYNSLRALRNKEVLDLSNKQIRHMIKIAIREGMLRRIGRGVHGYYQLQDNIGVPDQHS